MLEDSPLDADLSLARLRRAGMDVYATRVDTRNDFESLLKSRHYDIILADYALPDFDGMAALAIARARCPDIPFIIVSGVLGEEYAVQALQCGATDYVLKSRLERLAPAVERALSEFRREAARRKAAAELRNSQEFSRRVLESSRDSILTVTPDGVVERINPYGKQSMNVPDLDSRNTMSWAELWAEGDAAVAEAALQQVARGGTGSFEGVTRSDDGDLRYWDVLVTPVFDSPGHVAQILAVARDVSERHRAEHERQMLLARERQARADAETKAVRLQQSIEDLEHFASIASHDLKEPLRTVTMYCQMLSHRFPETLDGEAREYLRFVEQGTRRMNILLQDLLSYSRVVHDEDEPEVTDMGTVVEEAIRNCSVAVNEAEATVVAGPMPRIRAHRGQMLQVFQNLIGNAVKYRGQRKPEIHITCRMNNGEWLFTIADNGIGFDPRYAERIFGIFKRLHRDEYPGTGIGLAICRRVVERHRGRIWAESEKGEGTRFHFTLPVSESLASGTPPPKAHRTA